MNSPATQSQNATIFPRIGYDQENQNIPKYNRQID